MQYTPAQQVALARLVQHAATLLLKHGKSWNIVNGMIEAGPLVECFQDEDNAVRRCHEQVMFRMSESLGFFFSEDELVALSQPFDPQGAQT